MTVKGIGKPGKGMPVSHLKGGKGPLNNFNKTLRQKFKVFMYISFIIIAYKVIAKNPEIKNHYNST